MFKLRKLLPLFLLLIYPMCFYAHLPSELNGKSMPTLAPMLKNTSSAVVNILVEKAVGPKLAADNPNANQDGPSNDDSAGPSQPQQLPNPDPGQGSPGAGPVAVGSGVILDAKNGFIVTNSHVVKDGKLIVVTLKDGRRYRAHLMGIDEGFDLAVIQIPPLHLQEIKLGNSDHLNVGDFVVAIGSPFGLTQTVTSGMVSALHRTEPHIAGFQSFIQTDAPINPGNSGGALIDMKGELVGINTAIVSPTMGNIGIGFAIPSNMVKPAVDQLIRYGKISRGMLGVFAQNITPELARVLKLKQDTGAIVTRIVSDSPADHAGLKSEDVILSINDTQVDSSEQLHNMLGILRPGTTLKIKILREHQEKMLNAKVGDPAALLKQRQIPFLAGMSLQNFTGLEPDSTLLKGVLVVSLEDASDGLMAGLMQGDVITQANNKPIDSVQELITQAEKSAPNGQLLLKATRSNGEVFVVVQLGE